jgi:hypothetical protein
MMGERDLRVFERCHITVVAVEFREISHSLSQLAANALVLITCAWKSSIPRVP